MERDQSQSSCPLANHQNRLFADRVQLIFSKKTKCERIYRDVFWRRKEKKRPTAASKVEENRLWIILAQFEHLLVIRYLCDGQSWGQRLSIAVNITHSILIL